MNRIYQLGVKTITFLGRIIKKEEGVGIVEIALIIVVLIGLALLFKEKITALLTQIFDSVNTSELMGR